MEYDVCWPEDNGENYITQGIGWPKGLLCCPAVGSLSDKEIPEAPVLTYVTDMENNVIFEVAGGEKPWEHIGEHLRTVREDRVWNYDVFYLPYGREETKEKNGYHFEGTKTLGEKEYSIFRDSEENELAYVRQEGSKVYLYTADIEDIVPYWGDDCGSGDENGMISAEELLLYDFSLEPGERFVALSFYNAPAFAEVADFTVTDVFEVESCGYRYRCLEFVLTSRPDYEKYRIIEGIGSEKGMLPFPEYYWVTSSIYQNITWVRTVTDTDGEVIYRRAVDNPYDPDGAEAMENVSLSLGYDGRTVTAQGEGDVEMTVMSLEGVAVLTCSGNGTTAADVAALMPGVYVAEACCGSTVKRMKFIVK